MRWRRATSEVDVLLPAGVVERIDTAEKKIYVDRTKDQIKNAPEYDERADDECRDWLGVGATTVRHRVE